MKRGDKKQRQHQVKNSIYFYFLCIMLILLIAFIFIVNFTSFYGKEKRESLQKKEKVRQETQVIEAVKAKEEVKKEKEPSIYFLTNRESKSQKIIKAQLSNIKENYGITSSFQSIKNKEVELLIVDFKQYTNKQVQQLKKWNKQGMTLLFLEIPNDIELQNHTLKKLLGIKGEKGFIKAKGIRLSGDLFFGTIQEEEKKIEHVPYMVLRKQTEVFAHALLKDKTIQNEELPPLFWRHQPSIENGSVYVLSELLSNNQKGYLCITSILENIRENYLYPIINAYCVGIKGIPYTKKVESPMLEKRYGRDSLSIQFDIFMPQLLRMSEKYGVPLTLYSREYVKLQMVSDRRMKYYIEEFLERGSEIGQIDQRGNMQVDSPFYNQLMDWNDELSFQEQSIRQVNIPSFENDFEQIEPILLQSAESIRSLGFTCSVLDIDSILESNGKEKQDWKDISKQIETVLKIEKERYPWLDRVTISEAILRIQIFKLMEVSTKYSDTGIQAKIDNYAQRAWFYLSTQREIEEIEGGEITSIGNEKYLIKATDNHIKITYRK